MKFFQLKITLGRVLAVPWATAEKNWCLQRPTSVRRLLQANLHISPLAKTRMWTQGSNLDCTTILRQSWEELLPWERTPWHWSKHFQFKPIMTVPQRLSFSELLSNCNLATSWHIELSILGLLHLSISIHLRIVFSCSMRFFQLKITLGLALGETWPWLAQPQKNTGVYQGLIPWEGFCRQTCINYLRQKQGCELLNQI